MFFLILSRVWDKEKIPSPHEESNVRPSESALWTIIDDKVCKLALRVIVLSTLVITSLSEEKKKAFWLAFFEQRMVCIYTQTFFLGKQNIKVRMDFFLSVESIA